MYLYSSRKDIFIYHEYWYGYLIHYSYTWSSKSIIKKRKYVAQYADDIAIWVNTTLRKHTNKRVVNYVQELYQSEWSNLIIYIKENGLELSREKTCLMRFNNGENPKCLPQLKLVLHLKLPAEYKVYGGMHNYQVELEVIYWKCNTKARKRLHFL